MANYAIGHREEFERMEGSGDCTWLLARKALGTQAFGYNWSKSHRVGRLRC
jgi:hypothetical protein